MLEIMPLLKGQQRKGLALLGVENEKDIQENSHLYYFVRKMAMRSLYRQLRSKGMPMNKVLCLMSNYFSLSIDRVRDIIFR